MSDNPMRPLSILYGRLANESGQDGLILHAFVVLPNIDPELVGVVQGMFLNDPDWTPPDENAPVSDPEFEKVIADAEKAEREQKADEARESLTRLRDDLKHRDKGIGLDG